MKIRRTGSADYGRFIKALICGPPGAGKTLTSSTWPNPIFASAEGGLMSIADRKIPYVEIETSRELLELKHTLDQDASIREKIFGFPVDTVIVDTIDEIQKILIRERLAQTKKETFKGYEDWGWLGDTMDAIVTGFRNLDLNVVVTCHTKDVTDEETGKMFYKPALQGAIADTLPKYFDLNLLLRTATKREVTDNEVKVTTVRYLQTFPDTQHQWVKDRSGKLPAEVPVNFTDDYERIHGFVYGGLDLPESTLVDTGTPDEVVVEEPVEAPEVLTPGRAVIAELKEKEAAIKAQKPAPAATKEPEATPVEASSDEKLVCVECGSLDLDPNQATLSKIRFRKVLCRPCFMDLKQKGDKK